MITVADLPVVIFLLIGALLSVGFKKLTIIAALTGALCGFFIYKGAGYTGIAIMASFFIAGTLATGFKFYEKQAIKAAERDHGRRRAGQVLANAGVAAMAGGLAYWFPAYAGMYRLLVAASFSAAMADTLASELGTLYGKRFYNIMTLKPDTRGLDGVISLEGMLIGVAGSILIAIIYGIGEGWDSSAFTIVLAGTVGNLADSYLGAGLERRSIIKNDGVNLLNTLTGALTALVLYFLMN